MSEKTGIPCMVDVVAESPDVLIKYLDFVADVTPSPLLINGPSMDVRVEASKYAVEVGLQDRVVYNSINYTLNDREIEAIRETGIKSAIIQAFNPMDPRPRGMITILKGSGGKVGLLEGAAKAGIEKPLILTPVLDVPSIGFSAHGIRLAKEEFGLPTGTAPVGVVGRWGKVQALSEYGKLICRAGAAAFIQAAGSDFIIYGSLAKARTIFPVCAMVDAILAYNARSLGVRTLTREHPLYKIF